LDCVGQPSLRCAELWLAGRLGNDSDEEGWLFYLAAVLVETGWIFARRLTVAAPGG